MAKVRMGVIGAGNMGGHHAKYMNQVPGAELAALADTDGEKRKKLAEQYPGVAIFDTATALLDSKKVDAILIATPHYDHVPIALAAFERGIHVLSEKPMAVSIKAARQVAEAYTQKYTHLKFGIMFQQRTSAMYQKLRELVVEGELGEINRVTWIITNWFRTWAYYASGGWRATWKGEGGGVLINQCPHNLDLIQFVVGGMMPKRVTAVGFIGKTHPIEVEDDISAIFEYENGAVGHFITTTGEAPGTNRLEICGDQGKIVAENGKLVFHRLRKNARTIREQSPESFPKVEAWPIEIPFQGGGDVHKMVTDQFVQAILNNTPNEKLYAPGTEGVKGLEIGNAMLMSGIIRKPVELPMSGDAFDAFIDECAKKYGGKKKLETKSSGADMGASFAKA